MLEFEDVITTRYMNPSGDYNGTTYQYGHNIGGWPASAMYTYVNNDLYNILPTDLRSIIIDTTVVSSYGNNDSAKDLTRQLDYYNQKNVTTTSSSSAIKKSNIKDKEWWLRSAKSSNSNSFFNASKNGKWSDSSANNSYGVSPAFRIG